MKMLLIPVAVVVAGAGVGAGAAWGTDMLLGQPEPPAAGPAAAGPAAAAAPGRREGLAFVPVTGLVTPLVMADGRLAGYVSADVALGVEEGEEAEVTARLPLLLHAVNMRTYRTPLAAGPDGMLADVAGLRAVVLEAAPEALGPGVVHEVAITRAVPG
jgi:hypothetical protein